MIHFISYNEMSKTSNDVSLWGHFDVFALSHFQKFMLRHTKWRRSHVSILPCRVNFYLHTDSRRNLPHETFRFNQFEITESQRSPHRWWRKTAFSKEETSAQTQTPAGLRVTLPIRVLHWTRRQFKKKAQLIVQHIWTEPNVFVEFFTEDLECNIGLSYWYFGFDIVSILKV